MSLINDALKTAQRERGGQAVAPTPIIEGFFPRAGAGRRRGANRLLIGGGAAVLLVVIVGATTFGLRGRARATPRVVPTPGPSAPVAQPVRQQAAPVQPVAQVPAPPAAPPASSVTLAHGAVAPSRNGNVSSRKSAEPRARTAEGAAAAPDRAPRTLAAAPAADSTAAPVSATPVPAAPPTRTTPPTVHVTVDRTGAGVVDSLFRRAYFEHTRGNYDAAQNLYEQAIHLGDAPADLYADYAALLNERKQYSAAVAMLQVAIQKDDRNVNAWIHLGDAYDKLGQTANAVSAYMRAEQLDGSSPAVKVSLARQYEAIGDTASAHRQLDDAVRVAPGDAASHYALGVFLVKHQDMPHALRELDLFLQNASGKYPDATIERVRAYVAHLRGTSR